MREKSMEIMQLAFLSNQQRLFLYKYIFFSNLIKLNSLPVFMHKFIDIK